MRQKYFIKATSLLLLTLHLNLALGVAIAKWISLCLPSCGLRFESQAHHLCFYQFIFELCRVEKTKINKKRQ